MSSCLDDNPDKYCQDEFEGKRYTFSESEIFGSFLKQKDSYQKWKGYLVRKLY